MSKKEFSKHLKKLKKQVADRQRIKVDDLVKVELLYAMNYRKNLN